MSKDQAIQAVSAALSMGIALQHKALNGDCLNIGLQCAKQATTKGFVRYEYYLTHSLGEFISPHMSQIATWAVEQAGPKIGVKAERACAEFILNITNTAS